MYPSFSIVESGVIPVTLFCVWGVDSIMNISRGHYNIIHQHILSITPPREGGGIIGELGGQVINCFYGYIVAVIVESRQTKVGFLK